MSRNNALSQLNSNLAAKTYSFTNDYVTLTLNKRGGIVVFRKWGTFSKTITKTTTIGTISDSDFIPKNDQYLLIPWILESDTEYVRAFSMIIYTNGQVDIIPQITSIPAGVNIVFNGTYNVQ